MAGRFYMTMAERRFPMPKTNNTPEPPGDKEPGGGVFVVVRRIWVFFGGTADKKTGNDNKAIATDNKSAVEGAIAKQGDDKQTTGDANAKQDDGEQTAATDNKPTAEDAIAEQDDDKQTAAADDKPTTEDAIAEQGDGEQTAAADDKPIAEDAIAEQGDDKQTAATDNAVPPVDDKIADKTAATDDALTTALQEAAEKHEHALAVALQEAAESHERALAVALQETAEKHEHALTAEKQEAAKQYELLMRKAAELDNLCRRAGRETETAVNRAVEKIALAMCDVRDCFDLAIGDENQTADNLRQGIKAMQQKTDSELQKNNILPVRPDNGVVFDPELHEAVATEENAGLPKDAVVHTVRTGYTINSRLLRPASVIVSKPAAQQSESNGKSATQQNESDSKPAAQQSESDKPTAENQTGGKDE
ncbi:MAG: nucleotide exchange factor GrpE [Gammaproteobacteria bacterium]